MTELPFRVSFGDVDPYLIHWTAYPRLMDRGASAALADMVPAAWLRDGNHVGVARFRCAFRRPVAFGDELRLVSEPSAVDPDRIAVHHSFHRVGDRACVAHGVTIHHATQPAAGGAAVPFPRVPRNPAPVEDTVGAAPGDIARRAVRFGRRVHLRQVDTAALHWLAWLEWVDEGMCTLLAAVGHPISGLHQRENLGFPLTGAEGELRPVLGLDQEATVTTAVERVGRSSMQLAHRCRHGDREVGWARTFHVCVEHDRFRPVAVPDWLR